MRVQYSGHVIQAETRDHYTALPLVEVLVCIHEFLYKFDTVLYKFRIVLVGLNRSYSVNTQPILNEDILEKANCNFGFLQLLFYNFYVCC